MYLPVGRGGRGVQETLSAVVEDVFSMIGKIYHCRAAVGFCKYIYDTVYHGVGIADCIIVGIHQLIPVGCRGLCTVVGFEVGVLVGIAFLIVEMTAVGMKHYKHFAVFIILYHIFEVHT